MTEQQNRIRELYAEGWVDCRQSVLIVDDSAMNRQMLGEMLGNRFDTAEAASGEECLRLLEENRTGISIVLLDINMPGIDGFAVLEAMKRQRMLEEIPVVMISSEDGADTVRRALIWARWIISAARLTPSWCAGASSTPSGCTQNSGGSAPWWQRRCMKLPGTASVHRRCSKACRSLAMHWKQRFTGWKSRCSGKGGQSLCFVKYISRFLPGGAGCATLIS